MELKSDQCAGRTKGWLAFQLLNPRVLRCHSLDRRSWYSAGPRPLSRIGTLEWIAIESDMRRLIRAYLHCMTNAGSAITEPLFWCRSMLCGRSAAVFSVILTCFPHLLGWFLHIRLGKDLLKQLKREAFQKRRKELGLWLDKPSVWHQAEQWDSFDHFVRPVEPVKDIFLLPSFLLVGRVILPLFPPTLHRVMPSTCTAKQIASILVNRSISTAWLWSVPGAPLRCATPRYAPEPWINTVVLSSRQST